MRSGGDTVSSVAVQDAAEPATARAARWLAGPSSWRRPRARAAADLMLWRLAGGRPAASNDAAPGRARGAGRGAGGGHTCAERRRKGAHYTPEPIADGAGGAALAGRVDPSVGDPACGGGALLLAAARRLADDGVARPDVVGDLCGRRHRSRGGRHHRGRARRCGPACGHRPATSSWRTRCSTAVALAAARRRGRQPALPGPAGAAGARPGARRRAAVDASGPSVAPYIDTAALFLLAAVELARPGGALALLVTAVAARRPATRRRCRRAVARAGTVREVVGAVRPASTPPWTCASSWSSVGATRATPDRPPGRWSPAPRSHPGVPEVSLPEGPTLGEWRTVVAGFRSEYYGLVAHVAEADEQPTGRAARHQRARRRRAPSRGASAGPLRRPALAAPVVDVRRPRRAGARPGLERTGGPKVRGRVADPRHRGRGRRARHAGCRSCRSSRVLAPVERLWRLAAALGAPPVAAWAARRAAGTGLSARARSASRAAAPPRAAAAGRRRLAAGAAALAAGDLDAFAVAMTDAYGVRPVGGALVVRPGEDRSVPCGAVLR